MKFELPRRSAWSGRLVLLMGVLACQSLLAQTPPAATQYTSAGSLGGVAFSVTRLKRNTNGSVTLTLRLQGTTGKAVDTQAIGFTQTYSAAGERPLVQSYTLVDLGNKKRYEMLVDSEGGCLCTHLVDQELTDLGSGKSKDITIRFPAPPADVTRVTVELPHAEAIDDVPITN